MSRPSSSIFRSRAAWMVLRVVLLVEVVLGAILVVNTFGAFLAAPDEPLGSRLSILIAALLSWVWVIVTLVGAMRGRGWARGSAITLHVLLFAAATGVLQGIFGEEFLLGVLLILLAFAGFFVGILAKPIQANK